MPPKRKRKKSNSRGVFIFVLFIGGLSLLSWWKWATESYSSTGAGEKITISSETTITQLAKELQQRHLIRSAWAFRVLVHMEENEFILYAGDYEITPVMSPAEIINYISNLTNVSVCRVTIPEGYNTKQIINLFVQNGIGSEEEFTKVVTEGLFDYAFLENAPAGIHRLEGYLSPNTYEVDKKTSPRAVIEMLLQQFSKELTPEISSQLEANKMSVSEWVTLGSLIEKEAQKETDRPLIASVFMNRLKIKQPLQSCATIQFLLGTPKEKLLNKDLQIPSPYNTYLHAGLPPGPIANPGRASLQAALNPAQTDYFYFVAKGDGYHAFAKTYTEHLANVELYQ